MIASDSTKSTAAKVLIEYSARSGLGQIEIAKLLDLKPGTVSAVVSGRRSLSLEKVVAVARVVGMMPGRLVLDCLRESEPIAAAAIEEEMGGTIGLATDPVLRRLRQLSPKSRTLTLRLVDHLTDLEAHGAGGKKLPNESSRDDEDDD